MKILFDSSWCCYRAKYALGGLSHADMQTGIIYGFLEQVRHVCSDPRLMSSDVMLFFDSRSSKRKAVFPGYKAGRHKNRTEAEWAEHSTMKDQLKLLQNDILPACGFPCLCQPGLESDDLMAQAADQIDHANGYGVMVTADGDLWQAITERVHWYDPARQLYLDYKEFWIKHELDPRQWAEVKAIAGCTSDCVPGVAGVGEASAIRYVLGDYPRNHKRFQAITSTEGLTTIQRNRGLVRLPHPDTAEVDLAGPKYDYDAFLKAAARYGFRSFLDGNRAGAWGQFFTAPNYDLAATRQQARKAIVKS